jgi:hypothetical protein
MSSAPAAFRSESHPLPSRLLARLHEDEPNGIFLRECHDKAINLALSDRKIHGMLILLRGGIWHLLFLFMCLFIMRLHHHSM